MNVTVRILTALCFVLTASCNNENQSLPQKSQFLSPKKNKVHINPKGEKVITLDPLNAKKWTDPDLQALDDKVKASRAERVAKKLEALEDEKIEFKKPILTMKKSGQMEVSIDVIFQGKTEQITFLSPQNHPENFYFKQISGFDERKVWLQGMCLGEEGSCSQIAVETSYIHRTLEVTEQFIMHSPEEVKTPEETTEDEDTIVLDPEPKDNLTEEKDGGEPPKIVLDAKSDEQEEEEATDETQIDISGKLDQDDASTPPPTKAEEETQNEETQPPAPEEVEEENTETDDNGETFADDLDHSENNPDLIIGDGQIVFPDLKKDDADETEDEVTETLNVNSAEVTPKEQEIVDPIVVEEPDTAPKDTVKDTPNVMTSPIPEPRPKNLVTTHSHEVLLSNIKETIFGQSKGFYSAHSIRGRIKNASQLKTKMKGAVVNPTRRGSHYSSGMLKSVLEYAAQKLEEKYSNSPICINDLSAKKGGRLKGHASHRNGLDADISLPSTSNRCSGNTFFHSWSHSKKQDPLFMEKNWYLLNTLLETERIHVIFTSRNFVKSMCSYAKRNTRLSRSERNKIFKKLHHAKGHHKHFHVRLKCNKQNVGCVTQGVLKGSTCN